MTDPTTDDTLPEAHVHDRPGWRSSLRAKARPRKGVLEADELGPLGATTAWREDFAGRELVDPTGTAVDYLGRPTTATHDFLGRPLRRRHRTNSLAVTLGEELQFTGGQEFTVKTAGTTAASQPAVPAVGADVTDGTAVLTRTA